MSETETASAPVDAETIRYRHVLEQVARRPWAMLPSTLAVVVDLLHYRSRGHRLTEEEVQERIDPQRAAFDARRAASKKAGAGGQVAVLPVMGVIAPRTAAFDSVSSPGGTGVDAFTQMFRQALGDPSVGSILLEIDSPGGQVDGVPELADEIRRSRGQKPIVAIANTCAASAAYWIASACDEIVVSPSGEVGSVGVYCAHQDLSGALEQAGRKVTLISAGKFKVEGNPFEPLSAEALAAIQADVDEFYGMFTAAVAKGRGVAVSDVVDGFGQGRMVLARTAVKEGMADRVGTFDDTVARLARGDTPAGKRAAALRADDSAGITEPENEPVEAAPTDEPETEKTGGENDEAATTPDGGTPSALAIDAAHLSKPWVRDAMREVISTGEPDKED